VAAWSRTAAGRAKTPGGWPGENGSRRGSAGCCGVKCTWRPLAGENPGSGRWRQAAPDPGLRGRRCRVSAGLELEGRLLVLLVTDAQHKVIQGAANDGVGAVIKRLERRYDAVPPHEHRWCAGEVIGQLRRRAEAVCLVEVCSAALSVLENCSRKIFEGNSGEFKNWPGKMSGEPNTA
jgi:hypothetical protein